MRWIFLIFIIIPVLEMLVLIEVGSVLGSIPTVALVFITAIIGVTMLQRQGLKTLMSFNQKLNSGELPAQELLAAVFLVLSGAFLLTPGFVTDSVGFLLLVPTVRNTLADYLIQKGMLKAVNGFEQSQFYSFFEEQAGSGAGNVYDAQETEEAPKEPDNDPHEAIPLASPEPISPASDEKVDPKSTD